ncbi:hypothetical protein [Methylobacterium sp. CM6257]
MLPVMTEPTYIAALTEADYPRFREKDPTLPETYAGWLNAIAERVITMSKRGENPVRYPIRFSGFAERNGMLGIEDFSEAARDDYADEQGHADAIGSRL